eukprot:TRINITY_DN5504_c0_g1_i1.p1 TRINITY_DN5504_c0_g1~~TRINITY_DN5504_c0_g1_i1.p1  ORF type:complete len:649 (+),score=134.90 TRINITY_DN5504_c0_g1_i1:143-2089(+)
MALRRGICQPSSLARRLSTAFQQTSSLEGASGMLSDLTVYTKYARFVPELERRETWAEIVTRNKDMHLAKFPELRDDIERVYEHVYAKRLLPSMRSLQFGGKAVAVNNTRMFNCSFLPIRDSQVFGELMFLLMSGTGVGFSVQRHHIAQLPRVVQPRHDQTQMYQVPDSLEGWATAAQELMNTFMPEDGIPQPQIIFDYSLIRPSGAPLLTAGGRAPGPEPLRQALELVRAILTAVPSNGQLSSLQAHDIVCHLSTAVASGGVRRSALISLFSPDDEAMIGAKSGEWYIDNNQRAMANNSAVLDRSSVTEGQFRDLWQMVQASGSGEPGIYFTNNLDWGANPCCEIALEPYQFCNLTEINASVVRSQEDLNELARAAALIGTLQASYTDFHYLRPEWKEVTDRAALLGVSMTGIASGTVMNLDLHRAALSATAQNAITAADIGIRPAHRVTTVKPAGTTSLVLGTSSGVHAWHNDYYIRRMRVAKAEPIYDYLQQHHANLIEDDNYDSERTAVLSFPQRAPRNAILRSEPALNLLARVEQLHRQWISPGHRHGDNTNNVSTTVSVRQEEWDAVGEWMWKHRDSYNGLCVLPHSEHTYQQAPFEDCDEQTYHRLSQHAYDIDLTEVKEQQDETAFSMAPACAGQQCDIN